MKTVLIAGATGLTGSILTKQLSQRDDIREIICLVRHSGSDLPEKVREVVIDYELLSGYLEHITADYAFCCLGTTLKKAGGKEQQFRVDHDYVVRFAELCKNAGIPFFGLVSSIGANPESRNFYLRTKGQTEQDVQSLNFERLVIVRPSFLLGKRKEFRAGEKLGILFIRLFSFLMTGSLRKYKGIHASDIAQRFIYDAFESSFPGVRILESDEIAKAE